MNNHLNLWHIGVNLPFRPVNAMFTLWICDSGERWGMI